jgi:hypothetical protein
VGNPSKKLTFKDLEEVEAMAGLGLRFDDIAQIKGMCDDTLKKYANDALKKGKAKAKAQVMQTAYKMAVSGKHAAMTMFWLKTQCQWQENHLFMAPKETNDLEKIERKANMDPVSTSPGHALTGQLAETLEQVRQGTMDPRLAAGIASIANSLMKATAQADLEARLASLESTLNNRNDDDLLDFD